MDPFEFGLIIIALPFLCGFAILILQHLDKKSTLEPGDKCLICKRVIPQSEERISITSTIPGVGVMTKWKCKDCMLKQIQEQDGICPYCKDPIEWNEPLNLRNDIWYHNQCARSCIDVS